MTTLHLLSLLCLIAATSVVGGPTGLRGRRQLWGSWWSTPAAVTHTARVWTSESFSENDHRGIDDYPWPEQQIRGWGDQVHSDNVGIAVSGGGTRSYTAGFGQLRGLFNLNLLGRVRYMAGISGGAWLASNYIYTQTTTDDKAFLSAARSETDLGQLTMDKLSQPYPHSSLAFGATQDLLLDLVKGLVGSKLPWASTEPGEAWGNAVGSALMAPYGTDADKYFTLNSMTRDNILGHNPSLHASDFILPASERDPSLTRRPFMILGITGSGPVDEDAFGSDTGKLLDPRKKSFIDLQATPLYTGYPLRRDNVRTYYDDGTGTGTGEKGKSSTSRDVGGLVESFAFGGAAPSTEDFSGQPAGHAVHVGGLARAQDGFAAQKWTLKRAAGASSAWGDKDLFYLEQPRPKPDGSVDGARGTRTCKWWAKYCTVVTSDDGSLLDTVTGYTKFPVLGPKVTNWATGVSAPRSNDIRLSDGDVDGDILGLIDVLVRRVPASVGFLNTEQRLCTRDQWDPQSATTTGQFARALDQVTLKRCIASYLPPLFGFEVQDDHWGAPERSAARLQIFRQEDFVPLVRMLQDNLAAGNTAFARVTLTTVENAQSGIPAGLTLDWALFYLSDSAKFRALLPQDTQNEINKGANGPFANFPNYFTMGQNGLAPQGLGALFQTHGQLVKGLTSLTHAQVRLMSALTTWAVEKHQDALKDLFANAR